MGLFTVTRLEGVSFSFAFGAEGAEESCFAAGGGGVYWGAAAAGAAETTWVTCSSFCLMVTLKSFCSIVNSPIFDLLIILINSWICLKSMFFNLTGGFW